MQTLSLVIVTFTYLLVGAAVFDALEGTNNENALEGLLKVSQFFFAISVRDVIFNFLNVSNLIQI